VEQTIPVGPRGPVGLHPRGSVGGVDVFGLEVMDGDGGTGCDNLVKVVGSIGREAYIEVGVGSVKCCCCGRDDDAISL
jgi:hypothetical protein